MAEARCGTFDELMAESAEGLRPIARRLRQIVFEVHPEAASAERRDALGR